MEELWQGHDLKEKTNNNNNFRDNTILYSLVELDFRQ